MTYESMCYTMLKLFPSMYRAEAFVKRGGRRAETVAQVINSLQVASTTLKNPGYYNISKHIPQLLRLAEQQQEYEVVTIREQGHYDYGPCTCNSAAWGGSNADYGCFGCERTSTWVVDEQERITVRTLKPHTGSRYSVVDNKSLNRSGG